MKGDTCVILDLKGLSKIEGHIKKEDTFYREAISSTERLAVCLR